MFLKTAAISSLYFSFLLFPLPLGEPISASGYSLKLNKSKAYLC